MKEMDPSVNVPLVDWILNGVDLGGGVILPPAKRLVFKKGYGLEGFVVQVCKNKILM